MPWWSRTAPRCADPAGRDPDRQAGRAGTTPSEGTLGRRRIQLTRPRVRSQSGQEVELPGFAFASHRDPLAHHATRGSSLPDRADRWDRPGRPLDRGRARHRYRGQEADAGAAGRPHRTQPRRQGAAARLFVIDGAKALTSAIHPSVLSRSVSRPEAVPMRTCTELHSYQRPVCLRIAPQLIPGAVETWGDVPIYLCDALVLQRLRRAATLHRDSHSWTPQRNSARTLVVLAGSPVRPPAPSPGEKARVSERGVCLARRKEGAARPAVTDAATPPDGRLARKT